MQEWSKAFTVQVRSGSESETQEVAGANDEIGSGGRKK